MTTSRVWAELSGPAIARTLADQPDLVGLVPVGATEQHGPHLPTGTDTILAQELCLAVSREGDALVLPALPLGASLWHGTELPGTLALAGDEVARLAVAAASRAARSGVGRLLFVNGHVGNGPGLAVACDRLRVEVPDLRVGVVEWWRLDEEIVAEVTGDADDWHANRAETSLMLAVRPDLVDLEAARGADDPDRSGGLVFSYAGRHLTRNGVTGSPSMATPALGEWLWELVVRRAGALVARARVERPPLP